MQQQPVNPSSGKLIVLIKSAYWVALLIIAAMAMASFILLQQMMAAQQRDEALLTLASTQKALSQRVVFLANAADQRAPRKEQPRLVASLRQADHRIREQTTTCSLERTGADPLSPARHDPQSDRKRALRQAVPPRFFSIGPRRQRLALHFGA